MQSICCFLADGLRSIFFEEARYCFVYGQFMATILLGMAYMERTSVALFYAAGRSDLERANISRLLGEAVRNGWLDQAEFEQLDQSRVVRNAITHFRRPMDESTIEYRSVTQEDMPNSILEEDARHVLLASFHILAKGAI